MNMTDKPTPPDGYEVMLGKDLPLPVPLGSRRWRGNYDWTRPVSEANYVGISANYLESWYAVPIIEASTALFNDPMAAPEGYALVYGRNLPTPVPESVKVWDTDNALGPAWRESRGTDEIYHIEKWYAVPVQESADHCLKCDGPCERTTGNGCKGEPGFSGPPSMPEDLEHEKFMAIIRGDTPPGTDPKKAMGDQKPPLQLIPPALNNEVAKALARGAEKYGVFNWRENRVELMTYLGAMKRHIDQFLDGEDIDPDTGAHHLGCVGAGCGIVLDARQHGTLVDNRPPKKQTA